MTEELTPTGSPGPTPEPDISAAILKRQQEIARKYLSGVSEQGMMHDIYGIGLSDRIYADPYTWAQEEEDLKDVPYWDKLKPWEQWVHTNLPKVAPGVWNALSSVVPEDIKKAISAVGTPLLAVGAPVLGFIGSAFDLGAEGLERLGGMGSQYRQAVAAGTEDWFFSNLGQAWKASQFAYHAGTVAESLREDFPGGLRFEDSAAGIMARAQGMLNQGMDPLEINEVFKEEYGALWMRGSMIDLVGHIVLDPINYVLPFLKPVERIKSLRIKTWLSKTPEGVQYLDDAVETASRYADEAADALTAARRAGNADEIAGAMARADITATDLARAQATRLEAEGKYFSSLEQKFIDLLGGPERFLQKTGGIPLGPGAKLSTYSKWKPWTWFQLTPQAQAAELIELVGDHIGVLIKNLDSVDEVVAAIRGVTGAAFNEQALGHFVLTYQGRTVQAALQGAEQTIMDLAGRWAGSAREREVLQNIAIAIGKSPEDVLALVQARQYDQVLRLVEESLSGVAERELTGVQRALVAMAQEGSLNRNRIKGLGDIFLSGNTPFDLASFKTHAMGLLADNAAKQAILQHGVKARGFFTKAANALKAAEAMAYLRLNPAYPIRNFLNNELTMAARGVWNAMPRKTLDAYWDRVGIQFSRYDVGFGVAEVEAKTAAKMGSENVGAAVESAREILNKATRGDVGIFDKIAVKISKGGDALGPLDMGAFAARIEAAASRRAFTAGWMKAMRHRWKPGDGITHMDEYMTRYFPGVNTTDLGPGFVRKLHNAIKDCVNEKEIDDLFFRNLEANFDDVLEGAAEAVGRSTEDIRRVFGDEFIEALRRDVTDAIERGDLEALDAVFNNAYRATQDHLDALTRDTTEIIIQRTAARMEAEGPIGYYRLWGEAQAEIYGSLEGDLSRIQLRAVEIRDMPPGPGRRAAWRGFFDDNDAYVRRLNSRLEAQIEGILRTTEEYGTDVVDDAIRPFRQQIEDINRFHAEKKRILNDFYGTRHRSRASRTRAWNRAQAQINRNYDALANSMYRNSLELDEQLFRLVRNTQPTDLPFVRAWRKTVADLRRNYMDEVRNIYRRLETAFGREERQLLHNEFGELRAEWLNRLAVAEKEGYQCMELGRSFGTVNEVDDIVIDTYARHLADEWGPQVLHNTRSWEELTEEVAKKHGLDLSDPVQHRQAKMLASGELDAIPKTTFSAIEDGWRGAPKTIQDANIALRELEEKGISLRDAGSRIAATIEDKQLRAQWQQTIEAVARAEERGLREVAHQVIRDSSDHASITLGLHKRAGGATYNPTYGSMSRAKGYAVSVFSDRGEVLEAGAELTEDVLADFVRRNADLLADPRTNVGTWLDEATGETYLDISIVVGNRSDAIKLGRKHGQKAIFDLRTMADVEVKNPAVIDEWITTDPFSILDDAPILEMDMVRLERYAPNEIKILDPSSATGRTGVAGADWRARANYGSDYVDRYWYYRAGYPPEPDVIAKGKFKYTIEIPEDRLYDMVDDPMGYLAKNDGDVVLAVRDARNDGWGGYFVRHPEGDLRDNIVGVFDSAKPIETTPWRQSDSARYLSMESSYKRDMVRKQIRQSAPQLSDEEIDLVLAPLEAKARAWAKDTGNTVDDWWRSRIQKVRPATAEEAAEAARWAEETGEIITASIRETPVGSAIIRAFGSADAESFFHEMGHLIRFNLKSSQADRALTALGFKSWTKEAEEAFADEFIKYLHSGIAPSKELIPIFDRIKNFLRELIDEVKNQGTEVNPELRKIFDEWFLNTPAPGKRAGNLGSTLFDTIIREEPMIAGPLDELWWRDGGEIFSGMRNAARSQMERPPLRISEMLDEMSPANRSAWDSALRGYADRLKGDLKDTQHYAVNYAGMVRDSALLNYNRRTYFDQGLLHLAPFAFWSTHSMYNWMLWSMDRPAVLGTFLKLKRWLETSGNKNMPQRFAGSVPIPFAELPFVPDWMGPAYVNPLRIAWPMQQWVDPVERDYYAGTKIHDRAIRLLQRQLQNDEISEEDYRLAVSSFEGPLWETAINECRASYEGFDPIENMSMIFAPHAPLLWAYHAARGDSDKIQPFLPATRTIKGLTALVGIGPETGVNIEGWFRKMIGLPEFDAWEDYRTDRQLSNMVAMGEIDYEHAIIAMEERDGDIFKEAAERAGKEAGLRVAASTLGISAMIYPYGEEESRLLQEGLYKAYELRAEGDEEAVGRHFEEHPEVKARLALFDTPEERMASFLVDQIWTQWHELQGLEKKILSEQLGEEFELKFLDKETRNPYAVDPHTLALWLRLMGGDPPGTLSPGKDVKPIELPPQHVVERVQVFYNTRKMLFGDQIWEIQSDYFKLEKGEARKEYLRHYPILQRYWDWRNDWLLRNPDCMPYIVEDEEKQPKYETYEEYETAMAEQPSFDAREYRAYMSPELYRLVLDYVIAGEELGELELEELDEVAIELGTTSDHILLDFLKSWEEQYP